MASREYLVARLAMTRSDLTEILELLTDGDTLWKPRDSMKSVGDLLLEIARKDMEIIGWLKNGAWPDDEPDPFDARTATLGEMRNGLSTTRSQTLEYIAELSDEQLEEVLLLPERWWEGLRLHHCPRSEMIRNISAHEWYHTGQLVTYLWAQGRNPCTW